MKVLVVDDEASIAELVSYTLKKEGFDIVTALNGNEALDLVQRERPDLIVLDLMLPGIDGIEVCKRVRQRSDTPIIMLTAKSSELDKVLGLELGADDYVTKPFSPRELAARVKAVMRRRQMRPTPSEDEAGTSALEVGHIRLDTDRHRAYFKEEELNLAPKEYELLRTLMANRGIVLSRDVLLERVWGYEFPGDTRTVDVHVLRLRQKIERDAAHPQYIETVRGIGYRMRD